MCQCRGHITVSGPLKRVLNVNKLQLVVALEPASGRFAILYSIVLFAHCNK
jgi:hypothetical protein